MTTQFTEAMRFLRANQKTGRFTVNASGNRVYFAGIAKDAVAYIEFLMPDRTEFHSLADKTHWHAFSNVKGQHPNWYDDRNQDLRIVLHTRLTDIGWYKATKRPV